MSTACVQCRKPLDDGARFCGVCGAEQPLEVNPELALELDLTTLHYFAVATRCLIRLRVIHHGSRPWRRLRLRARLTEEDDLEPIKRTGVGPGEPELVHLQFEPRLAGFHELEVRTPSSLPASLRLRIGGEDVMLEAGPAASGRRCFNLATAEGWHDLELEAEGTNLDRLGLLARVVAGDATAPDGEWARDHYDRILLDAPCSATGVIRRHPDIKQLRRPADIAALGAGQTRMLDALWALLRPGGRMVYATCSLLPQENEAQVAAFLDRHPDAREVPLACSWGLPRDYGRQTLPGMDGMDGFYYATLEKAAA